MAHAVRRTQPLSPHRMDPARMSSGRRRSNPARRFSIKAPWVGSVPRSSRVGKIRSLLSSPASHSGAQAGYGDPTPENRQGGPAPGTQERGKPRPNGAPGPGPGGCDPQGNGGGSRRLRFGGIPNRSSSTMQKAACRMEKGMFY